MENKKKGVVEDIINPEKIGFEFKDILQIIVGAFVLAIPVGFTQEVWELGKTLPLIKIIILMTMTLFFIGIFTYSNYHREHMHSNPKYHTMELTKRIVVTYVLSFVIVAGLMAAIQVTPWKTDPMLAFKIIIIVAFPASIGAVISDRIK